MLNLIRSKQPVAQSTHDFVSVDATTTLQQLFQTGTTESLTRILEFLKTGSFSNKKLIVPQHPENSHFVTLITTGPMQNVFTDADRDTVQAWVMSLS